MGVYIKMEMPTRCGRCDMCVHEADGDIDWHNVCCITEADIVDVGEKMVDCPLVPVPPHGRLIDADKFFNDICNSLNEMTAIGIAVDGEWMLDKLNDALRNAPTIIPAEEGET